MKKVFTKSLLAFLIAVIALGASTSAFAVAPIPSATSVLYGEFVKDKNGEATKENGALLTRKAYGICKDTYTKVYTGKGFDRWLHINPAVVFNSFTIMMEDDDGNVVWEQFFTISDPNQGSHWFIGSNVKAVYLKGVPGGVVYVNDTEH